MVAFCYRVGGALVIIVYCPTSLNPAVLQYVSSDSHQLQRVRQYSGTGIKVQLHNQGILNILTQITNYGKNVLQLRCSLFLRLETLLYTSYNEAQDACDGLTMHIL